MVLSRRPKCPVDRCVSVNEDSLPHVASAGTFSPSAIATWCVRVVWPEREQSSKREQHSESGERARKSHPARFVCAHRSVHLQRLLNFSVVVHLGDFLVWRLLMAVRELRGRERNKANARA